MKAMQFQTSNTPCTWNSISTDVVWDYQLKTWDDDGIWYVWGPDAPLTAVWTPDAELVPC